MIDELAAETLALRDEIEALEAEVATYRAVAIAALDALAVVTADHRRVQQKLDALKAERHVGREERLLAVGADDTREEVGHE